MEPVGTYLSFCSTTSKYLQVARVVRLTRMPHGRPVFARSFDISTNVVMIPILLKPQSGLHPLDCATVADRSRTDQGVTGDVLS